MAMTCQSQSKPHNDKSIPSLPDTILLVQSRNFLIKPNTIKKNSSSIRRLLMHPLLFVRTQMMINTPSCLIHRWNHSTKRKHAGTTKPTIIPHITTPTYNTAYAPIELVKNDPSVTPTLETLCTLDTCSSDPT